MASPHRQYLRLQPLGTSRRLHLLSGSTLAPLPRGAVRLAEVNFDDGWLVRLANGTLVFHLSTGAVRTVDQRKAAAALAALGAQ